MATVRKRIKREVKKQKVILTPTPALKELLVKAEERIETGQKTEAWTREWRKMAGILWEKAVVVLNERKLFEINPDNPILKWKTFRGFSSWLHGVVKSSIVYSDVCYVYDFSNKPNRDVFYDFSKIREQVSVLMDIWQNLFKIECSNLGDNCLMVRFTVRHLDSVAPPELFEE